MHPRERVLGLASLLYKQGKPYPARLILEARRLGIKLPKPKSLNENKETTNGSSQSS